MRIAASLLISILAASPASAADFTFGDALAHYSLQQYDKALAEWQVLADKGDAKAEYYLGLLYETGRGTKQDIAAAIERYKKAAAAGQADAAYRLSRLARHTDQLPADGQTILGWLQQAAEGGVADAQYELGAILAEGKLVPRNLKAALDWFSKAETGLEGTPAAAKAAQMRKLIEDRLSKTQASLSQ